MLRHIKHLGNVPQNGHRFSQNHPIVLSKRHLKKLIFKTCFRNSNFEFTIWKGFNLVIFSDLCS